MTGPDGNGLFDQLPEVMRDTFLEQAFVQMQQQDLVGVLPAVCRLFQQHALRSLRSIEAAPSTKDAEEQLSRWLPRHAASMAPHLTSLVLDLRKVWFPGPAVPEPLQAAAGRLTNLRRLSLSGCSKWQPLEAVELSHLTHLTGLRLSACRPCSATLHSLSRLSSLRSLEAVQIHPDGLWNEVLPLVVSSLTQLTFLDLSDPIDGRSIGLEQLDALAPLSGFRDLKELRLEGTVIPAEVLVLLQQLPLTSVGLLVRAGTTSRAARWLRSSMDQLHSIQLVHAGTPTEARQVGVMMAPLAMPYIPLREVKLMFMPNLLVNLPLLVASTQLTSLVLFGCELDDRALPLLYCLYSLRNLNLNFNPGITGSRGSLAPLASNLSELTRLDMLRTSAFDAACRAFATRVVERDATLGTIMLRPLQQHQLWQQHQEREQQHQQQQQQQQGEGALVGVVLAPRNGAGERGL